MRHIYPKNVYTLRETLFEKLEGFNIPVSKDNTLLNNLAIFEFETIWKSPNLLWSFKIKLLEKPMFQLILLNANTKRKIILRINIQITRQNNIKTQFIVHYSSQQT